MVLDDLKIPQSISIARFLARRFKLDGKDELEQLKTDVLVDTLSDLRNSFVQKVFLVKDEDKAEAKLKFVDDMNTHLGRIEKLVKEYGSNGYSVGSSLTWSDFELYEVTERMQSYYPNVLENSKSIINLRNSLENHPIIGVYLKNRPVTSF